MATLYENYITGDSSGSSLYGARWCAQTFTPTTAHKITSVKLLLYREGSPGTITVGIRAVDGSEHPTGADLCSGTTNGNTLPTASPYEWREITLGAGYNLVADTKYAIVVRATGGDSSNRFLWRYDDSSATYTGGCIEFSTNSGSSWTSYTSYDTMFEDWGDPLVSAPTVTTQAVTDIQPTTATGNGNITDTGGENCDKRGIVYGTSSQGDPGDTAPGDSAYDDYEEETDGFGTGAFTRSLTGLDPGQHYYVRAYAHNSAGYSYGAEVDFYTTALLQPSAIASQETFGALTVVTGAVSVLPTAIGSLEAFGTPKLVLYLKPSAIPSGEAFGTPTLGTFLSPSSIASEEAFGAPIIAGPILVTGIASGEQFGTPIVTPGGVIVAPTGISSEELFGLPKLNVFVTPSGIVTSEALGTAKLNLKLILSGIASAEAFGTPTVKMILVIRPSGIASVELFGTPLLIVILAGGDGMKLPTTKGQVSIPSKEVII